MISECITYLENKLKAAMGTETVILHTAKELSRYAESHVGAILLERDALTREDTRSGPGDGIKVFGRALQFSVVIGEYTMETIDPMYTAFLSSLDRSFALTDGHRAAMDVGEAEWTAKEDGILLANVAALIPITISGGIYKMRQTAVIDTNITIEEDTHGNQNK